MAGVEPAAPDPRIPLAAAPYQPAPRSQAQLADSAVQAAFGVYFDSAKYAAEHPGRQPGDWTKTTADGGKWGWDPGGIRLGKFTIPNAVLAALPLDLFIGFTVTGFALLVGGSLGLVAGFWDAPRTLGGFVSAVIMRVTDIFLAFPSLVLALAIAASLGRGTGPSILAILFTWWPYYVRLVRGEVLAVKHQPYVVAARAAGVSNLRILFRHVLRNVIEPVVVYYTLDVGTVIVTFSTISFIGIGVPLNVPEWGNMVLGYETYLLSYPWTILSAGAAIFVTVLALSLLGDGLRDVLDPRSRRVLAQAAVPSALAGLSAATAPG